MMNIETKRHIDSARQILVGVVPNPSTQIDQITNALIYKFMDDMDQSVIKIGGKPTFFTGDLEKYAWTRLMDARIGGQERMNLYSEALIKFSQAKQLPELFRDIFKLAVLPYRSPEVLDLFLKEINYFDYSHSEELGNAFEYLLSVMGSQGDAGMFRTPRHIIEFIVDVVNPTKDDKILDPACGTAGFLISAYKHILEQHDGKDDPKKTEKPLTPEQKKKLTSNFIGYDISPDMVRLSKVNMYLHSFKDPQIVAYNTLADEERWNDKFDVILANPPFMSPKGGIKPHNKFSIPSSRSEVLFVDYIMNHLRPKGRAGIIVPEGIIFQSGTSHKQLRKNLVEDGLYAVVSLPSGVFAPYSGVKTSILLFNNELAKTNTEILFVKIESDGFDLGAQRRISIKNDLPQALVVMNKWNTGEKVENKLAVYVEKSKIAENGEYNLSVDRYRIATDYTNAKWPMMELKELCEITTGKKDVNEGNPNGEYPFFTCAKENTFIDTFSFNTEALLIAGNGDVGAVKYYKGKFDAYQRTYVLSNFKNINVKYLFQVLNNSLKENMQLQKLGNTMPYIKLGMLQTFLVPLPPLEIQEQIVAELDGYAGIIAGAKQITQNWKPQINIDPEWKKVKLGEISDRVTKGTTPTTNGFQFQDSGINFIKIESIDEGGYFLKEKFAHINQECNESLKRSQLKEMDVLFSIAGALGRVALVDSSILPANTNQALAIISPKNELNSKYLEQVLRSDLIQSQIFGLKVGVAQSNLSLAQVSDFEIPLPSLEIQKQIVEKIEAERALVESSKKLIEIYDQKTKEAIAKLWTE
jgi:type I restriction enzyme M protein